MTRKVKNIKKKKGRNIAWLLWFFLEIVRFGLIGWWGLKKKEGSGVSTSSSVDSLPLDFQLQLADSTRQLIARGRRVLSQVATARYSFLAHQFTHNKVNIPWHLTLTQIFSNLENLILAFYFQQLFNISIIPAAHLCQFYLVKIDVLLSQIRYLNVPCVTRAKDFITHRAISIINLFLHLFKKHLVLLSSLKNLMEIWWHIRILVFRPLSSH